MSIKSWGWMRLKGMFVYGKGSQKIMQIIKEQNCEELCWRGRRQDFLLPVNAPHSQPEALSHPAVTGLWPGSTNEATGDQWAIFNISESPKGITYLPMESVNDLLCSGLFWSSRQLSVATSVVNSCWSRSPADNCMWSDWVKNRKTNEIVLNGACLVEGLFQNMRFKGKGTNRKKNKTKNSHTEDITLKAGTSPLEQQQLPLGCELWAVLLNC